jgi:hypothetical protein
VCVCVHGHKILLERQLTWVCPQEFTFRVVKLESGSEEEDCGGVECGGWIRVLDFFW